MTTSATLSQVTRDKEAHRNNWRIGRIVDALPSTDGEVTRANVLTYSDGQPKTYIRPISELILIVESRESAEADVNTSNSLSLGDKYHVSREQRHFTYSKDSFDFSKYRKLLFILASFPFLSRVCQMFPFFISRSKSYSFLFPRRQSSACYSVGFVA